MRINSIFDTEKGMSISLLMTFFINASGILYVGSPYRCRFKNPKYRSNEAFRLLQGTKGIRNDVPKRYVCVLE